MDAGFLEFLGGLLGAPIVQDSYNAVKTLFVKKRSIENPNESNYELTTQISEFTEHLDEHLREVNEWSKETKLNNSFKPLNQIYVKLKFYLNLRRTHVESETAQAIELTEILTQNKHIAIYGGPGSGKSTSMKYLCQQIFSRPDLFDSNRPPIVVRFRELNPRYGEVWHVRKSISKKILDELGIKLVDPKQQKLVEDNFEEFQRTAIRLLNSLKAILILDGFDEISSLEQKQFYADEIRKFSINLSESTFIITSRTGDFNVDLDNTLKYEIAPLSEPQIREFIKNWLQDAIQTNDLFNQIRNSPFNDTAVRPLTLSQLCSIYDRSPNKKIPEKPKSVYSLVVQLLLKEWNESRGVNKISKYAGFEIDRKEEFLYNLAYLLSVKYNAIKFNKYLLREIYKTLANNFSLPPNEVDVVLDELESHNGLFVQSGYDTYEFSHLSLQEYLTAKYIVSIGTIPTQLNVLEKIPSSFAIATVISANQTEYFYNLIYNTVTKIKISTQFIASYLNRLYIEKPDFSVNPLVSICVLTLLDKNVKAINQKNKGNKDLNVASLAELENDYLPIVNIPIVKMSFQELGKFYKWKNEVYIIKYDIGGHFMSLKRYKNIKDDFATFAIPNELIVPNWIERIL
jgi:predicted NACHT family NTPase